MTLRDQLRTHKGTFYNWPPIWTHTRQDPTDKPQGEIGNLEDVWISEDDYAVLFIAIEYHGRRYVAQWDLIERICVSRFPLSYSRISVFQLKRSATSNYRKIASPIAHKKPCLLQLASPYSESHANNGSNTRVHFACSYSPRRCTLILDS
jgi:hypothetical protein